MEKQNNNTLLEECFVQYILNLVGPTKEIDTQMRSKYSCVYAMLNEFFTEKDIPVEIVNFGSFPSKIYHINSDLDVTMVLLDRETKKVLKNLNNAAIEPFYANQNSEQARRIPKE